MAWTEAQKKAIETRDCGLIVSAAAGSGKTSVLVERLLQILMDETLERRVPADRLIVVTFTNDAAAEMKARLMQSIELQLQNHPDNRWLYQQQILLQNAHICTISSFCFDLIRDNLTESGVSAGFRILNDTESRMIEEKAADVVLNQWHATRSADIRLLWNYFCEKNDKPLEQILLELHTFLSAVPFRDQWQKAVLSQLAAPVEHSVYHLAFLAQLQTLAEDAAQQAQKAVELANDLYDSVADNTVLPWVEDDYSCIIQMLRMLQEQETDAEKILRPYRALKDSRSRKNFPRKKKNIADEKCYTYVKQYRDVYKKIVETLVEKIEMVMPYEQEDLEQHQKIMPLLFALEADLAMQIWETKVQKNALGFEDGERLALELLADCHADGSVAPSPLATSLSAYYQLIMIDEYQDSNNKQDEIFKLLSRNCIDPKTGALRYGDNVFLVGDVKQSIYRFRLANPQNFVHAIEAVSEESSLCHHITLRQNFRSTPAVLYFVNFICGNLMSLGCGGVQYHDAEALDPGSSIRTILPQKEQRVKVAVLRQSDVAPNSDMDEDIAMQAQYIIRQIQKMIQEGTVVAEKDGSVRPCRYSDFCILLRTNPLCQKYAHALEAAGIPVQSTEEKGYLRAREITILLDMLRVLDNPLLDTSFAAIMLSPMFGYTADELLQIRLISPRSKLYAALIEIEKQPQKVTSILGDKCHYLLDTIRKLRQSMAMMSLEELIRRIYDMTDFLSVMQLTENGDRKRANLQLLLQYARQYEENTDTAHSGVSGFLRYIDWLIESGHDFQQTALSAGTENAVVLKTMHRSKGLEFPFVFLSSLETRFSTEDKRKNALFSDDGLVGLCLKDPSTYTRAKTLPFVVIAEENEKQMKSEELRLLYVAMTRAKQQLFLVLDADKTMTKKGSKLDAFASLILPNGTLPESLVQSAGSMAHWIWMCLVLLHPVDLDAKFSLPSKTWKTPAWSENLQVDYVCEFPDVVKPLDSAPESVEVTADPKLVADLQRMLAFSCQSEDSSRKTLLSVSGLQEARHNRAPVWKRPQFLQEKGRLTGTERGTAVHTFFEYANFQNAQEDLEKELVRLQQKGFLTSTQMVEITPDIVNGFFQDPIFQRMQKSKQILREQKFRVRCSDLREFEEMETILAQYADSESMLSGIIDLAFLEENGYVLVDYKTDFVNQPEILIKTYREQIMLYRAAISCITQKSVTACYLYSTHLKQSIPVVGKEKILS